MALTGDGNAPLRSPWLFRYGRPRASLLYTSTANANTLKTEWNTYFFDPSYPKLATLKDDFSTIDSALWTQSEGASDEVQIVSDQLNIKAYNDYPSLTTANIYDLEDSSITWYMPSIGSTPGNGSREIFISVRPAASDGRDAYGWLIGDSPTKTPYSAVGGSYTYHAFSTWSPTNDDWLRIRESAGTIYADRSADGTTWVNIHSKASPGWIREVKVQFAAGNYGTQETPDQIAIFDKINLLGGIVIGESGAFTVSGTTALVWNHPLVADAGSYAWTGTDAGTLFGREIIADPGVYDWTGTDATLTHDTSGNFVVTADPGSYAWTGTDAGLLFGREIAADVGSYAWTGTDAGTLFGREITADPGSYAWTGTDAGFLFGREIAADVGSYAWTGVDPQLEYNRIMVADPGSYAWAGTDAGFLFGREITADPGSYTWTGTDAGFLFGRAIAAAAGSYTWTGVDPQLEYGRIMGADPGSYAWTGTDAGFLFGREIAADVGSYAWTGIDAGTLFGREITADVGSYAWTGTDAGTLFGREITADVGSYAWTGTDATLTYTPLGTQYTLTADPGSYAWAGTSSNLLLNRILTGDSGAYIWTGTAATFLYGRSMVADPGSYAWVGTDASLLFGHNPLVADAGAYTWTGTNAALLYSRYVSAGSGFYAWTGTDVTLTYVQALLYVVEMNIGYNRFFGQRADYIDDDGAYFVDDDFAYFFDGAEAQIILNAKVTQDSVHTNTFDDIEADLLDVAFLFDPEDAIVVPARVVDLGVPDTVTEMAVPQNRNDYGMVVPPASGNMSVR